MHTKISDQNSKLGKVPNVSLTPIKACGDHLPCFKHCYALKAYRQYPATKTAWDHNYSLAISNIDAFFSDITEYLQKKRKAPRFFRWHVAGDILSEEYFAGMVQVAIDNPGTIFLAFTKRYEIVNAYTGSIPKNLTVIFSAWPGLTMDNPSDFPVAWYQDGTEKRLPDDCLECPGNCETCGMCFQLPKLGKDVVFNKH